MFPSSKTTTVLAGTLMPGESFQHRFDRPGEYFYNDPSYPQSTGKIVVG